MTPTQKRIAKQYKELDEIMAWVLEAKDKEELYAAVISYAGKFSAINLDAKRRQIKAGLSYLSHREKNNCIDFNYVVKVFKELKK